MTSATRRPQIPTVRKLVFSLLICTVVFVLLEAVLRIAGVGAPEAGADQLAGFSGRSPVFVQVTSEDGRCRMQTAERKLEWFNAQEFACEKATDTKRVFCLGGSTTFGRPYDDTTSFAGWLRELIAATDRGTACEIINAGGISYGSRRVLTVLQEVLTYQPDLVVIYCGHNEFLERTTYADLATMPTPLLDVTSFLDQHSRVFRTVRQVFDRSRNSQETRQRTTETEEVNAILDSSVGLKAYTRDKPWQAAVVAAYRQHLELMIEVCRSHNVDLLFVIPASQLKDCAPFKSEHTAGLTTAEIEQAESQFHAAADALHRGSTEQCIELCRDLVRIDPDFAHGHFLHGMALYESGRYAAAKKALLLARDSDVCPLRATGPLLQALRETLAEADVPAVDFERLMQDRASNGVPGADLFLDHVHPTIEAHRLLALEILRHPATVQMLPGAAADESIVTDVTKKVMQSVDTTAHGRALRNLSKVLSWAGKYDEADRLAIQAMQMLPDDSEALYQGGSAWFRQGDLGQAMAAYQRAAELAPDSAQAHFGLGLVHAERTDWPSAIRHYQKAAALKPDFLDIEFNLGRAYELSGDYAAAARQYQLCLELNDRFAPAYNGMGTVAARQGDMTTAIKWFRRAMAADPDDQNARMNLQQAMDTMTR